MKTKHSLNPDDSSKSVKKKKHSPRSIIPDYLLKQVEAHHQKKKASPEVLEHDAHNRKKSDQLRKQRQNKYQAD